MDLASLQVFLMVARERSFSRAAEKLYRSQPAVSIAVRKLEEWVGQPLFVRGSRAGQLTEAGVLLSEYAERMLNLRDEIRKGVQNLRELRRGHLSLGANESSIHALLPVLARYRRAYPDVKIAIHRVFSRDIPREVVNYRLDLGVISYVPADEKLAAVECHRDQLVLVVHPRHRLARRRDVDISELGNETFIAHIVESPHRRRVIQLFSKHRVPLRMGVDLPTIESIKRFVEMRMGVAIVPRMCVWMEIEHKTLAEVSIRQMRIPRRLYLIYRRDHALSHAAQALFRLLCPRRRQPAVTDKSAN
jgi:DNA-binding transcriptional LysR family regulator